MRGFLKRGTRAGRSSLLLAAVLVLSATACGSSDPEPATAGTDDATEPAAEDPEASETQSESGIDLEEYFSGKEIQVVVGGSAGGRADTTARLVAQYMSDFIPGSPSLVVVDQPGGGGVRALEAVANEPADGFTIGNLHARWIRRYATGVEVPHLDLAQVKWIGTPDAESQHRSLCTFRETAETWDDVLALGEPLTVGAPAPGSGVGDHTYWLQLVGGPIEMVFGYDGSPEVLAAFSRGELSGTANCDPASIERQYPEFVEEGRLVPHYWVGHKDEEWLDRLGASDVPHISELVPGVTDEQLAVLDMNDQFQNYTRSWFIHPDTPDEVHQALVSAFEQTVADPRLLEDFERAGFQVGLGTGDGLREILTAAEALSPEAYELLVEMVGPTD